MKVLSLFDGQYEVTDTGKIYSNKRKNKIELIGKICNSGYRMVILTINRKKKYINVHRLIAKSFIPNPENLPEVNHIDCNKLNNNVCNLEWVSTRENQLHAIKNRRNGKLKINMRIANEIRTLYHTGEYSHRKLSSIFKISKSEIGSIINNKRWKV